MSTNGNTSTARVYRGRSTAELIPTIQAELGSDAIVVARRSGLEGGIGGFFQRPFVEIEAQPAHDGVDLYDGGAAAPIVEPPPPRNDLALSDGLRVSSGGHRAHASGVGLGESPSTRPAGSPPLDELLVEPLAGGDRAVAPRATFDNEFASLLALATKQPSAPGADAVAASAELHAPIAYNPYRATPEIPRHAAPIAAQEGAETVDTQTPAVALEAAQRHGASATPDPPRSNVALAVAGELAQLGFDDAFAAELVAEAITHVLPFTGRIGLRRGVRIALERRIPAASALPAAGAALALVGPGGSGKTKCAATLAAAYRASGALPVGCASICAERDALKMVFSPRITTATQARSQRALRALASARGEGVVLLDTPAVSPSQTRELAELGRVLAEIAPDRTIAMVPATLSARAASQLLEALRPLAPGAIAITHADESDQLGVAVQAACEAGLAPEYLLTSARGARSIERVDPAKLAERLLP